MVFGQPYRLVALIVPVLLGIRRAMEAEGALARTPLCVGHPVHFEGRHAHRDRTGLARLEEACRYAGLPPISFYPEPLAATLAWLHRAEADVRMHPQARVRSGHGQGRHPPGE